MVKLCQKTAQNRVEECVEKGFAKRLNAFPPLAECLSKEKCSSRYVSRKGMSVCMQTLPEEKKADSTKPI
ncbi:hypothetical protein COV61_02265 [Candidatus Micrarchaeota archaeon CG11_big_fil_rev_8_21_14_0_20_47_5]|nr:MAG: hypothetical protein AUJ17_04165 [Candidatus Micrarchaeota archaeon CG1_02_47_40]PIN83732.1 MAG: hypothetical protein COV61_02265 [Candidatus Micrarchaeota archaeon CG11_big_fil_rev_8_21_14_0_20_47_5]QBM01432.1 hypothetical protein [uncultured archaeon]